MAEKLAGQRAYEDEGHECVRIIPHKITRGGKARAGTIQYLQDRRYLTICIDLKAGTKKRILNEISKHIGTFKATTGRLERKRKKHKSTSHVDLWAIYDGFTNGKKQYQMAKELYRKRNGTLAGFSNAVPEFGAIRRAIESASRMIETLPYPPC
jgi:hypothetical protein